MPKRISDRAAAVLDAANHRQILRVDGPADRYEWRADGEPVTELAEGLLRAGLLTRRYASTIHVLAVPTAAGEDALADADRTRPRTIPTIAKD